MDELEHKWDELKASYLSSASHATVANFSRSRADVPYARSIPRRLTREPLLRAGTGVRVRWKQRGDLTRRLWCARSHSLSPLWLIHWQVASCPCNLEVPEGRIEPKLWHGNLGFTNTRKFWSLCWWRAYWLHRVQRSLLGRLHRVLLCVRGRATISDPRAVQYKNVTLSM